MQRGHSFGVPVGLRQAGVNQKAVAFLHQPIPDKVQLRLLAFTLTIEPVNRIGGRSMGVVRSFLAVERSASALRPPPCADGPPEPSFGFTLIIEGRASISVPSTEK